MSVDDTKVSVFAHSLQPDRLRANDWVTAALQDLAGARGGGKANTAQGSATVGSVATAGEAGKYGQNVTMKEAVCAISQAANKFTSQLGL